MRYGFCFPHHRAIATPELIARAASEAEQLGFDGVWLSDHVILPNTPALYPRRIFYEPLAVAGYLAAATSHVTIGFTVLIVPYRNPVVTAKQIATIDQLSGGRVVLGVGVGWVEEEFDALGVPFHNRGRLTDEYLQAMRELWSNDAPAFDGATIHFSNVNFWPKPRQRPGPPLLVAGVSRRAIERAIALGDGWNPNNMPLDQLQRRLGHYRAGCAEAGRPSDLPIVMRTDMRVLDEDPDERVSFTGTPKSIIGDLHAYADAGIDEFIFDFTAGVNSADEWHATVSRFVKEIRPFG